MRSVFPAPLPGVLIGVQPCKIIESSRKRTSMVEGGQFRFSPGTALRSHRNIIVHLILTSPSISLSSLPPILTSVAIIILVSARDSPMDISSVWCSRSQNVPYHSAPELLLEHHGHDHDHSSPILLYY